jgi:hypothetical protein
MTPNTGQSVTDDREMIESNVRRIVGITILRRIHKLISERRDEEQIMRTLVAPIAALAMIVIAALIWTYGSPRADPTFAPLPECSPPRSQNITI